MAADGSIGPGPGRQALLREVLPFLLSHSLELNIQQVHDYVGCAIWKAERAGNSDGGWKTQPVGSQMGKPWAGWIHVEAGEWGWDDGRPVVVKLGLLHDPDGSGQLTPVQTDLIEGVFGLFPLQADKPELMIGAVGDLVLYLQSVIFHRFGRGIARDGQFGEQTRRRVHDVQRAHRLAVDGRVGPRTWKVVDRRAG